jgi:ribose transport system substrate-binding protein
MRARRTTMPLLAVAMSGILALTACTSSSDSNAGPDDSGPKKAAAADVDIAGATAQLEEYSKPFTWTAPGPAFDASSAKGKKVVYIPVDGGIPMMSGVIYPQIGAGLEAAGVDLSLCDGKGSPDQWSSCIDDSAGRGADVIILDSFPLAAVKEAVDRAKAKGVKIIDSNNGDPGDLAEGADASVSFQYSLSGKLVSDWIIKDSGGDANILIIRSPEVGNVPALVDNGYVAELKDKCPTTCKYKIVDVPVSDWATKLQSTVQAQLAGDPSINYVVPIYDGMSTYVVPGLQAAGAQDRVKVATFNANLDPMKKMADNNSIFVDIGSHSPYEGWAQADQALRLLVGEPPVKDELVPARVFDRGNVGDLNLTQAGERSGEWFGDDSYKDEYQKLWGLG